jgi:fatty-acyl-CoA synthase
MDDVDKIRRNAEAMRRIQDMPDPLSMMQVQAARFPAKDAFIHLRHADDLTPQAFNYAQAQDIIARFASALKAIGIGPQDSVAIIAPSIPETLFAIAGAASVAIAFPLNLLLSAEAMANQLKLAGARAVVTIGSHPATQLDATVAHAIEDAGIGIVVEIDMGHGHSNALANCGAHRFGWDAFLASGEPEVLSVRPGARTAFLFHTGGTTGAPKLAELSMNAVMASVHASAVGLEWQEDERVFQLFPFFHVGGAFVVGLSIFSTGVTLINASIAGARDPAVIASLWPIAARVDATFVALAPASWSLVAAQGEPSVRPPRLRCTLTGAAATAPELLDRVRSLTGVPIIQGLGMTELCGTGAYQPTDGAVRAHAVGFPAPLVETRLVPIAPDGPRELQVRGPMLFSGYRTAEGLVRELVDGWYASGDLGEMLSDGQLRLLGRAKDVIIRGGHNIDPLAIEDAVARHPDIVMAGAAGMPDAFAGELPVVYAVRKQGAGVTEQELLAFVYERIEEPPARPKRVIFLDALPLTQVGKLARYRLRQQAAVMRLRELLGDLPGVCDIQCHDVGARRLEIHWAVGADKATQGIADAEARPLGLTLVHNQDPI